MRLTARFSFLPALAVACLLVAPVAQAASHSITFDGFTTTGDGELPVNASPTISGVNDFSNTGADLGTAGYWFFNFAASTPVTNAAPESNDRRALPSWVSIDLDPNSSTYTFPGPGQAGTQAFSAGGNTAWSSLTLPTAAAETGLSGSVVAPDSWVPDGQGGFEGDSANIIENITLGNGTPQSFLMHVVLDNTGPGAGDYDFTKRLKVRSELGGPGGTEVNMRLNKLQDMDSSPDVYTFRFDNYVANDVLRLQVRPNDNDGHPAGIAGIMFDVVPEPTSALLLLLGGLGLTLAGRRRR